MGNISSRSPKTENSKSSPPDEFEVFMKGGSCKESFITFEDCAEKNKESLGNMVSKCFPTLMKCMEAHPDYYQPILSAKKTAGEKIEKEFNDFYTNLGSYEGYEAFMERGGCKESSTAWLDCSEEAGKKKESMLKCLEGFVVLLRCMEARSDYFQPFLAVKKVGDEEVGKEFEAFLSKLRMKDD